MGNNNNTFESILSIQNFLVSENRYELIKEIYQGLIQSHKQFSSRFFYDDTGSELFEEITRLPEYYPTRTEKKILQENAGGILGDFDRIDIIELGSGDCSKISVLLDAIPKPKLANINYIPVDVSESAVLKSADILQCKYPAIKIYGVLADFMKHLSSLPGNSPKLICFFGSTLGNLTRNQANGFLLGLKKLMNPGDKFLLGLDMVKDSLILHKAYNDNQGITARFNKNILQVVNDVADTNFNTSDFKHLAFYNEKESRIEMHLETVEDMVIKSNYFPQEILLKKGETIHTENSHKFTDSDIQNFATATGLKIGNIYTDSNQWFSLVKFIYTA